MSEVTIAYRTLGELAPNRDNVVLVTHGNTSGPQMIDPGGMTGEGSWNELVGPGKMSDREFHDAILKGNQMSIAMVRAILMKQKLTRDYACDWKFYGPNPLAGVKGSETP